MPDDKDKSESGPWQKYSGGTAVSDEHGPWDNYGKSSTPSSESANLEEYLSKPYSSRTTETTTREDLPGATPRLKASAAAGKYPITPLEQRTPGEGISLKGAGSAFLDTLKRMVPQDPTGGHSPFEKEFWIGENPPSFNPQTSGIAEMGREAVNEYQRSRKAGSGALPALGAAGVVGAGSALGVSNKREQEQAERGEGGQIIGEAAAPAAVAALPLGLEAAGKVVPKISLPTKSGVALALRTEEGALKPAVHNTARALGGAAGGLAGHAIGVPEAGAITGYGLGPTIADKLIPNLPTDIPTKQPAGAILPSIDEFYQNRAEDLAKRGKEQAAIDKVAQKEQTAQEKALAKEGKAVPLTQSPYYNQHVEALKAQAEAAKPKIVSPTEGEPRVTGSEGRPATWTNEFVLEQAGKGNRDAISQAVRRGLPLPANARYIMGDPDFPRAVLNPRETTLFSPEGIPIRNKDNPLITNAPNVPMLTRTPRAIPPLTPLDPTKVLPFPGPMPETTEAVAVGAPPPVEAPPIAAKPVAATAPTLLEPIAPMGIKPLENVKPIMEGTPTAEPLKAEEPEPVETKIKGITAEEPKAKKVSTREKIKPVEGRYGADEIQAAEGMLASEAGAMLSTDRPGAYFDQLESTAEGRKGGWKTGLRMGGQWRGLSSSRDLYPFMSENPDLAPSAVQKALRNKDSAPYNRLIEKAIEFNRRKAGDAYDYLRFIGGAPDVEPETATEGETEFNPEAFEKPPEEQNVPRETIPPAEIAQKGGILPGMEEAVAKQNAGAAKVAGENLTAEANKPKDISQAAGRMETLSPLFRGTEASPQREIFGNAPSNAPPAPIQAAIEGTDWKYAGKNNLGLYTIEEPGTKIRISLFERDLHPEFIRRKIAEKEKQFGAPEK